MGIEDNKKDEFACDPILKSAPGIFLHQQQRRSKKLKLLNDTLEALRPGIFKRDVILFIKHLI